MADPAHDAALAAIWSAAGGSADWLACLQASGAGGLPSVFSTTSLASAAVGAACLAVAELAHGRDGVVRNAAVDRRLASLWFGRSIRPDGWSLAPSWDAIAGDYRAARWLDQAAHQRAPPPGGGARGAGDGGRARRGRPRRGGRGTRPRWNLPCWSAAAAQPPCGAWLTGPSTRRGAPWPANRCCTASSGAPGAGHRIGPADRPLRGVRVLDLTRVLAGPVATRFLAGFGAEVLRIDPPDWDEPGLVPDVTLGKRCARLDLRLPSDRAQLEALLAAADVLVHGYRPDALARLGLDAQRRQALRPGLVDVSLDAYGWSGPWAGRRGFDSLVQMSSGIADAGMRAAGATARAAAGPGARPRHRLHHGRGSRSRPLAAGGAGDGIDPARVAGAYGGLVGGTAGARSARARGRERGGLRCGRGSDALGARPEVEAALRHRRHSHRLGPAGERTRLGIGRLGGVAYATFSSS